MSRSSESWFNVRVDSALEAGLNLGRAALDTQLKDLTQRAQTIADDLRNASDRNIAASITRLRENSGAADALVFSGAGRLVAFSSIDYDQLIPNLPPPHVIKQLRVSSIYSAAEADDHESSPVRGERGGYYLRVVVPIPEVGRASSVLGLSSDSRWLQLIEIGRAHV